MLAGLFANFGNQFCRGERLKFKRYNQFACEFSLKYSQASPRYTDDIFPLFAQDRSRISQHGMNNFRTFQLSHSDWLELIMFLGWGPSYIIQVIAKIESHVKSCPTYLPVKSNTQVQKSVAFFFFFQPQQTLNVTSSARRFVRLFVFAEQDNSIYPTSWTLCSALKTSGFVSQSGTRTGSAPHEKEIGRQSLRNPHNQQTSGTNGLAADS